MAVTERETSKRVLDIAERLVQTRGFNGFSYADISAEVGISKASLHYHFQTKAALGKSLVERYERDFLAALGEIDRQHDRALDKLKAYVEIYVRVLKADRMCLCGMLAADYATLPEAIQGGIRRFFAANEAWLAAVLSHGRARKEIAFAGKPTEAAHLLISALEGAMLLARMDKDIARFRSLAATLLKGLRVA
jgi:TetR/AcrR family transcriptional repressor of nem operon